MTIDDALGHFDEQLLSFCYAADNILKPKIYMIMKLHARFHYACEASTESKIYVMN